MYKKIIRNTLLLIGLALGSILAHAQQAPVYGAPVHNVVQLSADGAVEVQQDMLRITLSTTKQGNEAQDVQRQLKQAINNALQIARHQAQPGAMEVQTGQFSLYPSRTTSNRISGWQGSAEVILSGTDIARISAVAGKIQSLTISNVSFDISPELRRSTETKAQAQAIAAFRKKAEEITRQFGFGNYDLREVSVQADYIGGSMPRMRLAAAKAYSADESPLPTEPGKSTVRVLVQGTVQMR